MNRTACEPGPGLLRSEPATPSSTGKGVVEAGPRYLTKSRLKLALECPTKLFYTGKPAYRDRSRDDDFLSSLAEGGMQVGALACAMHPDGIEVVDRGHAAQVATTALLLEREEVTIFEAAFEAHGLFVRVDILRKRGSVVDLVEVKAKSFDAAAQTGFRNASGGIASDMVPYLHDIAFQRYVAALARPDFEFHSFLMLPDKSARATVQGLNGRFGPTPEMGRRDVDTAALGAPVLAAVPVDSLVDEILAGSMPLQARPQPYAAAVERLAGAYRRDERISPRAGAHCVDCQFKTADVPAPGSPRSGFHECWTDAFGWAPSDFDGGTVLDLWNHKQKGRLISRRLLKLGELTPADLSMSREQHGIDGMQHVHRKWYQCSGRWPGGGDQYVHTEGLRHAMAGWRFPLHFIDFETCAAAVPFHCGQRPYQTTAFQFSHHRLHADGRVEHTTQFLDSRPAGDPSLGFLRALRDALEGVDGTVFCWSTHENTVLRNLRAALVTDPAPPTDAAGLIAFVDSITHWKMSAGRIEGPRCMVDLCKLAERHYFHPSTHGRSGLKAVLPAVMRSSERLRSLYAGPSYGGGTGMRSLNFQEAVAWWVARDGQVLDPYDLLPPVPFDPAAFESQRDDPTGSAVLRAGGAAMSAYVRLQADGVTVEERQALEDALRRYCELDTLAMVMVVQAWQGWVAEAAG